VNFYNDNDRAMCQWLRELIAQGHLPPGVVDERSILELKPEDLAGFDQCHFFAGIGGWPLALRWAGLEGVAGIWTGSCPCQPLSCAGKRQGHADERHLWPAFYRLISECRPATVFGEQVASADGREWFAGVRLDLEGLGYAVGGADLCAAGVGAPHRRQRLFWVAMDDSRSKDVQGLVIKGRDIRCKPSETQPVYDLSGVQPWIQDRTNTLAVDAIDGLSRPVGIVRGYGNAIVPQVAAVFVRAWMECRAEYLTTVPRAGQEA